MRDRPLLALYRLTRRAAWWVLLVVLALALLALYDLKDLTIDSSFQGLLPESDPLLARFEQYQSTLQETDRITILLSFESPLPPSAERVDRLLQAGQRVREQLLRHEEIVSASYRRELPALAQTGLPIDPLALNAETVQEIEAKIAELRIVVEARMPLEGQTRPLDEVYTEIAAALEDLLSGLGVLDPGKLVGALEQLGDRLEKLRRLNETVLSTLNQIPERLSELEAEIDAFRAKLDSLQSALRPSVSGTPYLLSKDHGALLVQIQPRQSSQRSIAYNRELIRAIQSELEALNLRAQGIDWGLKGPYVFSVQSDNALRRDMNRTGIVTIVGVLLLFIVVLRRLFYPLMATFPVLVALIFTLALTDRVFGGLNLLTAFLPAIILGLGIDYGIQFISHYLEERHGSRRVAPALRQTLRTKGSAMLTAAAATSLVLFGLGVVARSRGLAEMGYIIGAGVLLSCLLTLLLLPAMIVAGQTVFGRRLRAHPPRPWDLGPLARLITRGRWIVLALVLGGTAAMTLPATRVDFTFVSEALMPSSLPSQQVSATIQRDFELQGEITDPESYFFFFVEPSVTTVQRVSDALYRLDAVDRRPLSYYSVLPFSEPQKREALKEQLAALKALDPTTPLQEASRRLEALRELFGRSEEIQGALAYLAGQLEEGENQIIARTGDRELADQFAALRASTHAARARLEALSEARIEDRLFVLRQKSDVLIGHLRGLLDQIPPPQEVDRLIESPPPEMERLFFTSEGKAILMVHLKPEYLWNSDLYNQFIRDASGIADDFLGIPMTRARLEDYVKRDFQWSTALAVIVIFIVLRLDLGRSGVRGGTWLSLVTLGLGYLWMFGALDLLDIDFNVANILISPLLIGLGVDNCVYLLHRHRDLSGRSIERALSSTALPIIANTLATMIGFGSLMLAETPVLRVLGESAVLGIGFMTLLGLTFLPAAVAIRR